MEIGNAIKWMAKDSLPGLMAENILENMWMIRNKDMEFLNGIINN